MPLRTLGIHHTIHMILCPETALWQVLAQPSSRMNMAGDAPGDSLWLRSPPELLVGLQGKSQAHKQQ